MSELTPEIIDELTDFAAHLAEVAGAAILEYFRLPLDIENKFQVGFDPVTEGDRAGERAMRALIEERYPDHGILGEEYGVKQGRSAFTWVLDPVDGTRSFIIGMPSWMTLVGLTYEGKAVAGIARQPYVDESFIGSAHGAFHLRKGTKTKLRVSAKTSLSQAFAGTTGRYLYKTEKQLAILNGVESTARHIRFDGDGYFFALMAAGHLDIAMDVGLEPYDIAALVPIIEAAGGYVRDFDGNSPVNGGNIIAAASQSLFEEVVAFSDGI